MLLSVNFHGNFCKINQKHGQCGSQCWEPGQTSSGLQCEVESGNRGASPQGRPASPRPPGTEQARIRRGTGGRLCARRGSQVEMKWCCPGISGTFSAGARPRRWRAEQEWLAFPDRQARPLP